VRIGRGHVVDAGIDEAEAVVLSLRHRRVGSWPSDQRYTGRICPGSAC
jgi:hypothetical protein